MVFQWSALNSLNFVRSSSCTKLHDQHFNTHSRMLRGSSPTVHSKKLSRNPVRDLRKGKSKEVMKAKTLFCILFAVVLPTIFHLLHLAHHPRITKLRLLQYEYDFYLHVTPFTRSNPRLFNPNFRKSERIFYTGQT